MSYPTGARPDTQECRERDKSECPFALEPVVASVQPHLIQRVAWIRNQQRFPSCYGQAFAAGIDAALGKPWASAVGIWREARRRQGQIERIDLGTRGEYAALGLVHRGWDDHKTGEDLSANEASKQDDLLAELAADDRRLNRGKVERFRIWRTGSDRLEQLRTALSFSDMVVVACAYLRPTFHKLRSKHDRPVPTLGRSHFGGGNDSHAMRVFAIERHERRYRVALQNSWGMGFGGIYIPDGMWRPGCVWVDESAIGDDDLFHDIHCIRVKVGK